VQSISEPVEEAPVMLKVIGVLVALVVVAVVLRSRGAPQPEIAPAGELRDRLDTSLEAYAQIEIDPANVPDDLRDLIPFAEQWGIGDDVLRADYEEAASAEEKARFKAALTGRTARITEWLDSFGTELMSEEAGMFMYMLEALDEQGLWPD
jgi:hypothetical protein